jgi:hypothetical protein
MAKLIATNYIGKEAVAWKCSECGLTFDIASDMREHRVRERAVESCFSNHVTTKHKPAQAASLPQKHSA